MYSPEFMKFLINYQKPEYNHTVNKQITYFNNRRGNKLATILLLIKK